MERQDVERIVHMALKELGVTGSERAVVTEGDQPGQWRIEFEGPRGRTQIKVKCGAGTTPQWLREQIFQQYLAET